MLVNIFDGVWNNGYLMLGGRNLALETSSDWSSWIIPDSNKVNVCVLLTNIYPGDKKVGDIFTLSFDIEVKKFTAGSGGTFNIFFQGAIDDVWEGNNPFVNISPVFDFKTKALAGDFTEHVSTTCKITNDDQASAKKFDFGVRCDYSDGTGKYRIKNLKVEKGTVATDWTPAPEDTFSEGTLAKQGSTGATGTTGSQWYAGTGITGTSTTATAFADSGVANARVNDMYLNTSTGNTYKCTVAGNATNAKWVYAGNIKGVQGDKGNTGATGNGISKADITYASSSSNTSAPTSGWQNTPPSVSPGQYLWTKTVFTYTNGGTATQYSVAKQGNTGAAGADAITVSITSSNGTVFKNNSGSTVLTAHVYKGAVEQTVADNGTVSGLGTIKWYKVGSDTAVATAKTLTVSANDVDNTQAYTCQLEG